MSKIRSCTEIAVIACLLLAGCGNNAKVTEAGWLEVSNDGGAASIKEVVLPSGRTCVVMIGYSKAAISCDWTHK